MRSAASFHPPPMRQFIERLSLSTACVIALAACSHFRHQNTTTYDVTPAGSSSGSAARLASEYGCTAGQVTSNWQSARLEIAKPGRSEERRVGKEGRGRGSQQ